MISVIDYCLCTKCRSLYSVYLVPFVLYLLCIIPRRFTLSLTNPVTACWNPPGKGHRTQFIFRSPRGKERPAQFIPPKEEEIAGDFPQQGARQAAVEPEGAVPLDNALHYCPNCTEGEIDPVSDAQWLNNKITDKKPLSVRRVCREQGPHRTQNWVLPTVCPWHHLYQCLRGLQA